MTQLTNVKRSPARAANSKSKSEVNRSHRKFRNKKTDRLKIIFIVNAFFTAHEVLEHTSRLETLANVKLESSNKVIN